MNTYSSLKNLLTLVCTSFCITFCCWGMKENCDCTAQDCLAAAQNISDNYEFLQNFPLLQDVEYQTTGLVQESHSYLFTLYRFNNAIMNKIIVAAQEIQEQVGKGKFNFVTLANLKEHQQLIADRTGLDIQYIRLYISRGIAYYVKTSGSPLEALTKIHFYYGFWDKDQLHLLLSFLNLEDLLMQGLLDLQAHITQLVYYKTTYVDFFCSDAVPFYTEVFRKIGRERLPYTTAKICKPAHFKVFKKIHTLISEKKYLKSYENLPVALAEISKLSESKDPFYTKLAHYGFHKIYENLTIDVCPYLDSFLEKLYKMFTNVDNWTTLPESRSKKQIQELIRSCSTITSSKGEGECFQHEHYQSLINRDISNLAGLYLDYHGLSLVTTFSELCRIIEDILAVFSEPAETHVQDIEGIIADLEYAKHHNQLVRGLIDRINPFIDHYMETYIPIELSFAYEFSLPIPFHPRFNSPELCMRQYRLNNLFQERQAETVSEVTADQQTVDYLMATYFPDECIHAKAQAKVEPLPVQKKVTPSKKTAKAKAKASTYCAQSVAITQDTSPAAAATPLPAACHAPVLHRSPVLRYHKRVLRWFNKDFAGQYPAESVLYHTFAPSCDPYILQEGLQDLWNGNIRYRLPAKITRQDGSSSYVLCCCTLTPTNQIYHRGYEFTSINNIRQLFGIQVPEEDSLESLCAEEPFIICCKKAQFKNRSHIVKENNQSLTLYDPINKIYITLFRIAATY